MTIQMISRSQVARGRPEHQHERDQRREPPGSTGTIGILNGRGSSGRVRRRTMMPIETITNAISVPMLTSDPSVAIGVRPAAIATTTPVTMVETCGVSKARMDRARPGRQQAVLGHRQEDARLGEHHHHHHRAERGQAPSVSRIVSAFMSGAHGVPAARPAAASIATTSGAG